MDADILKSNLLYSAERLLDIEEKLHEELFEIISMDSMGEDPKDLSIIIKGIRERFVQYSNDLESPFKIAVVGSQGTGKSTLVNLLLGESLMPSTVMENESAVIRLAYPPSDEFNNMAQFQLKGNKTKLTTIKEAKRIIDKASREISEDAFVQDIEFVTFYIENEKLQEIELINTPGMNVLTDDFYPKVKHLFVEADVILWVNSSEQILDKFNSWLIQKIHADNDKIVGIITFPDKLYRQDEEVGVTDVVDQFMDKLEGNKLLRYNDQIGLFILNGKFAQIATSQKKELKFVNDLEELEDDEEKLHMLYNFLHHGFAYSDDETNVRKLQEYKLYDLEGEIESKLNDDFELKSFFNYCVDNGFCSIDDGSSTASYSDKGRLLLGEASQYYSFGRFSDDYLIPKSKESKVKVVKERLARVLSKTDNVDNSISRLEQISKIFQEKKNSLDSEESHRLNEIEDLLSHLKIEYSCWLDRELGYETDRFSDNLVSILLDKIEDEIKMKDFLKEMGSAMVPNFLRRKDKESAVSKKMSKVIEEAMTEQLPISIKELVNRANSTIEQILIKRQKDFHSNKSHKGIKSESNKFSSPPPSIDSEKIRKVFSHLTPLLQGIVKKLLVRIAKKDLRKGANTFMKTNVLKPIVILIRKVFKKQIKKQVAKKAAQSTVKSALGPAGWLLIAYDLFSFGKDFKKMYDEMKGSINETLKNEPSFRNIFKNEATRISTIMLDEVTSDLRKEFLKDRVDEEYILEGIVACQRVSEELKTLKY